MAIHMKLCGTTSGPTMHRRHGEPVCAECREAERAYGVVYRQRPEVNRKHRLRALAQGDARRALSHGHPIQYRAFLREAYDEGFRRSRCQNRALTKLSQEFRSEYQELYQAAKVERLADNETHPETIDER